MYHCIDPLQEAWSIIGRPCWITTCAMASKIKSLLPGYAETIADVASRERYKKKLGYIGGKDPYELPSDSWHDDVDKWPSTTYIHVGMYLAFAPSPYATDQLLNYKSLESYERFVAGWVRDIFVTEHDDKRVLTAKVCTYKCNVLYELEHDLFVLYLGQSFSENEGETTDAMGDL